jgi:signal transduction histidine kinase
MARAHVAKSGTTLGTIEGFPGLRPADLAYKTRRAALTATAVVALVAGLAAAAVAIQGRAEAGVEPGLPRDVVYAVSPTGFGWRDGIRPGQLVVTLGESGPNGGWFIETEDAAGGHSSTEDGHNRALREMLPIGLAALGFGSLGVLFLRTRRRWTGPAAALALLAATAPLDIHGDPLLSTGALGAAAFVPMGLLAIHVGPRARIISLAGLAILVAGWAWLRLNAAPGAADAEGLRDGVAFWGTAAVLVERAVMAAVSGESIGVLRPRLSDVAALAALAAIASIAALVLGMPLVVVGVLLLLLLAAVPAVRTRLGRSLEDALFADVREQAAADATERERARLARELHDVPLQELVAVIRRLEIKPDTESESEDLRNLAGHLRNVATELRPPVLDDLGLPAALDFLAEQTTTTAIRVTASVEDSTGFGPERRPPTDVELAMYRIASEAVGNAIRHARGSGIVIAASVTPTRVDLSVADDGTGLPPERAMEAARGKRLGLASMRRRAEAIDADLSIEGTSTGTLIRVAWQA